MESTGSLCLSFPSSFPPFETSSSSCAAPYLLSVPFLGLFLPPELPAGPSGLLSQSTPVLSCRPRGWPAPGQRLEAPSFFQKSSLHVWEGWGPRAQMAEVPRCQASSPWADQLSQFGHGKLSLDNPAWSSSEAHRACRRCRGRKVSLQRAEGTKPKAGPHQGHGGAGPGAQLGASCDPPTSLCGGSEHTCRTPREQGPGSDRCWEGEAETRLGG